MKDPRLVVPHLRYSIASMTSDLIINWLARNLRFLCTGCGEPIYAWQTAIAVTYGTEHVGTFHEECARLTPATSPA